MGNIKVLSENVYRKIAAGEVIERPLSLVKELVENAIDAGATEIDVELRAGGKELVRVADNGRGFAADDIEIAFRRHSTSKLAELEDLDRLQTLGFRGEALPSILEVAAIDLETADNDEGRGWLCRFCGGSLRERRQVACRRGSVVTVQHLFADFPVRRKFLKSDQGELRPASSFLETIALARPAVAFSLRHNGRTVFRYAAAAHLSERIYQVFGKEFLDGMRPLDFALAPYRLGGFISAPPGGIGDRSRQFFTVNGRPVKERTLQAAFNKTFQPFLEKSRHAAAVLELALPPSEVDVNIHPMKLEIRFRDGQRLYRFVHQAIQSALGGTLRPPAASGGSAMIPEPVPRPAPAENAPGEAAVLFPAGTLAREEDFRILGQYLDSYIVVERNGELLIIDQHNARERVLFERLQAVYRTGDAPAAQALFPLLLELSPLEQASLDDVRMEFFRRAGFDIRHLSGSTVEIKAFPQFLSEGRVRDSVRAALREPPGAAHGDEGLLAALACHDAVKVNRRLLPEEMRALVKDLFACANPHFCPHRRPIIVTLTLADIEKQLKRR
ncbi:MAG: DNA mismatch repair endonuclease MutL [Candidatus Aminicenantes bacterium]|nr:DNA mismatch repair endonuclease MutL [Candidatus Aminicenantes bacterium]